MIRRAVVLVLLAFLSSCLKPPGPAELASDAARELNMTARYGELAGILGMTSPGMRQEFVSRRAEWGKMTRVVDVELAGLTLEDRDRANILVDFSWTRSDENVLKTTRVMQGWSNETGNWTLVREKRVSGDLGLFGEAVAKVEHGPRPDVQFPTRVIR
jgi:hypothetical protein